MSQAGKFQNGSFPPFTVTETITGDIGGPVGPDGSNNINIITDNAGNNSGSSVLISGNPGTFTLTLNVSDVNNNTLVGADAGNLTLSGSQNSSLGSISLHSLTTGSFNSAFGYSALRQVTTGANNTAVGNSSGLLVSTASGNTSVGSGSLASHTTGLGHNTAIGFDALLNVTTGHDNTALGYQAGQNYVGAESNNIVIGNVGTAADAGIIRIGTSGTHIENFQAGIAGVTPPGAVAMVIVDTGTGQLGSQAIPSGTLTQLSGDTGVAMPVGGNINVIANNAANNAGSSVKITGAVSTLTLNLTDASNNTLIGMSSGNLALSGSENTAVGNGALESLTSGTLNVAMGSNFTPLHAPLGSLTSGSGNIGIGAGAASQITTQNYNTAVGHGALWLPTNATGNVAIGTTCLQDASIGDYNTAVGYNCLIFLGAASPSYNIGIGANAGGNYNGAESSNIVIGSPGVNAETHTMRLGATGAGNGQVNRCFLAGVDGVNVGSVAKVLTMASEQVGTATITAGTNITVTPGANTITIAASGGGAVAWSVISANQTAVVNNGYFCNKAGTLALALPAVSAVGDVIEVVNINTATGIQFTQAAGQQIFLSTASTTLGATGTLTSSAVGDSIKLVCRTANQVWWASSMIGNWSPV